MRVETPLGPLHQCTKFQLHCTYLHRLFFTGEDNDLSQLIYGNKEDSDNGA